MNYQNIAITKDMYKNGERLTSQLERLDPSAGYSGELAGLDAFERQLKRFDIKVSGERSDLLQKFFSTGESASLFPEYVARAVGAGMEQSDHLGSVIAAKTMINSLDYRTITTDFSEDDKELKVVLEGRGFSGKCHYVPEYKLYVDETVIYDRQYKILISIMRDVTDREQERKQQDDLKKNTVELTDQVIEKQMRVVQEIASLLGETTAETKIALTKLKDAISHDV